MRWDCMGCAGNDVIKTPNLDAIAERGAYFGNAFTPDPICVPARASIMTGNYPQTCTGQKTNGGRIKESQPLLTEVLKGVGYRTYALGKLHFVPYAPPGEPRLVHGFEHVDLHESGRILALYAKDKKVRGIEDYFDYLETVGWDGYSRAHGIGNNDVRPCASPLPEEHHVDYWIADRTIEQIDRHSNEFSDKPFFMWMSSPKPHSPYDPPRPYDRMYDPRELPAPFGAMELLKDRYPAIESTLWRHAADSVSPEAWQVIRSYYYGCVSFLDAMIGRVVDHLESKGLLENTIILFSSDHGDLLRDFGSCFKVNHLNGSVRVPFLAAGPGIASGIRSEELVGLQDILPTFAAMAGADIGQDVDGIDLSSHLSGSEKPLCRDFYYSTTETDKEYGGQSAMMADKRYKYIYSAANATEELYDQLEDPGELNNLAGDASRKGLLADMRNKLIDCAREFSDSSILSSDSLFEYDLDRSKFQELPVRRNMGWRWY
jgi:arylsulfatase A-like enzyme